MTRKNCRQNVVMLGMFALLAISIANAQIGGDTLKIRIPFDFTVGSQTFPSGDYSLKPLLPNTMSLRNQAGRVLTNIATNSLESTEAPESTKLVFNGYEGRYFLSQIWHPGDHVGREVIKSSTEVELARKSAAPQQIALLVVGRH